MFQNFTFLKTLLDFIKEPIKLIFITSWIFFYICLNSIYKDKLLLEAKLSKAEENCEKQITINRERSQAQINNFIEKSNIERDSTYRYFYKVIKEYNVKINKSLQELNQLKNENHN